MHTKEKEKEAQGTIYSNADLRKLILPLIMEQLLAILVGMLDTVMISGVGEAAVSGVSLVDNINILVIPAAPWWQDMPWDSAEKKRRDGLRGRWFFSCSMPLSRRRWC